MEWNQEETLVHVCAQHAHNRPDDVAYIFLGDQDGENQSLTFAELWKNSGIIGSTLLEQGLAGQRVLLVYAAGLDFILAFLGCLRAGVLAAPVSPPMNGRQQARLLRIAENFRASTLLTTDDLAIALRQSSLSLHCISTNNRSYQDGLATIAFPPLEKRASAFVQYTSGSTGAPKGVVVSHANIMHNQRLIKAAFGHDESTRFAGWLPLFHDMGLIGNVLHPLFLGVQSVLMSPMHFLRNPLSWLQMITDYQATTSGGPNFAYDYCSAKVSSEQAASLDLSSWRVAFNGAEPVRAETLHRFAKRFAPAGFTPSAFYPCYGLAEATLLVAGGDSTKPSTIAVFDRSKLNDGKVVAANYREDSDIDIEDQIETKNQTTLVSCGHVWLDDDLCIVNPKTSQLCADNEVGEIWVSSKSVAQGYWDNASATERVFRACLSKGGVSYLRTGDLGFLSVENELFITGRLSDLIIIRGRNYYPQDIELTAINSHPKLGLTAAAIKADDVDQKVYLFQELHASTQPHDLSDAEHLKIKQCINECIWKEHELRVHAVHLVAARSIPKTSSGKVRRKACLKAYRDNCQKLESSMALQE